MPPELAVAFNTPVEHLATAVVEVELDVVGTVVVVVVVEEVVVVGFEDPNPQAVTKTPNTTTSPIRLLARSPDVFND